MTYMPSSQPRLVIPGVYVATITGAAKERDSKFGEGRTFWILPLSLHGPTGDPVNFGWAFDAKNEQYQDCLKAIGGRMNASGAYDPPSMPEGRRFRITIAKDFKKNGDEKRVVVRVEPLTPAEAQANQQVDDGPPAEDPEPDVDGGVPF